MLIPIPQDCSEDHMGSIGEAFRLVPGMQHALPFLVAAAAVFTFYTRSW